jgi:hypothetical protein
MTDMTSLSSDDGYSWCRHCALGARMTAEHIPAHAAGNSGPSSELAWPDGSEPATALQSWPDGFVAETLCRPCNENGSRWKFVDEYTAWRNEAISAVDHYAKAERRLAPAKLIPNELIPFPMSYDRMPGRFSRYVVGLFLAAQRNELLHASNPHLMDAVTPSAGRGSPTGCDVSPARLFMAFANQNTIIGCDAALSVSVGLPGQTAGGLHLPAAPTRHTEFRLLVLPPFAFTLITAGPDLPGVGIDISRWTTVDHHGRVRKTDRLITVPAFGLEGFAGSPAPGRATEPAR